MPVLIYVIFVSSALFIGILTAPSFIGPVEPSGTVRFGMPAGHVPTTTAEMIALARKGAEDIRLSSASHFENVLEATPVAPVTSPAALAKIKLHKADRRAGYDRSEKRGTTADVRTSRRTLAFIPRDANEAYLRHGDLGNF